MTNTFNECRADDPIDGFVCTEPANHDGEHVACDEVGGECARWTSEK
jgi:hypothetical protein